MCCPLGRFKGVTSLEGALRGLTAGGMLSRMEMRGIKGFTRYNKEVGTPL